MSYKDLKGQRILLMSGSMDACEIVRIAKQMGLLVYATDFYETSPVKEIADKSFMVSTANVIDVVELCKREKINGIFSGYTDSVLPYMERVSHYYKVPFWGDENNIHMCIDKRLFKEACKKAKVPVVPWQLLTTEDYTIQDISLPVVVKPVDNSGSRGVFKCYNDDDLKKYIKKAFEYSDKKEVLIEQLMPVNNEFSVYYVLCNGKAKLFSMGDRFVDVVDENTAPQAKGMFFPSRHINAFMEKVDKRIKVFFEQNNMKDGFVFIQGFTDENSDFYINEIGYRLNGGFTYLFNEYYNDFKLVEQLILYSLRGEMDPNETKKIDPFFNGYGLLITVSLKEGVIGCIDGVEAIRDHPNVLRFIQHHFVGDELRLHGTSTQIFGYIHCVAKTEKDLKSTLTFIRQKLVVNNKEGESLLIGIMDL